jgi:PAS domain S-box-containing protein
VIPAVFCVLGILTSVLVDAARQRAERALRVGEDRYRDLVEHSEDLLCTHDLAGRLLTVNPAPARILGYSVEELLKMPMRNLIIPEGREEFDRYLERLRSTGQPEQGLHMRYLQERRSEDMGVSQHAAC